MLEDCWAEGGCITGAPPHCRRGARISSGTGKRCTVTKATVTEYTGERLALGESGVHDGRSGTAGEMNPRVPLLSVLTPCKIREHSSRSGDVGKESVALVEQGGEGAQD
jgi:hypothetical protein